MAEGRSAAAGVRQLCWRTRQHPAGMAPTSEAAALETSQALEVHEKRAADGSCIPYHPSVRSSDQVNPQNRHQNSSEETFGEKELGQRCVWSFENSSPAAAAVPVVSWVRRELH